MHWLLIGANTMIIVGGTMLSNSMNSNGGSSSSRSPVSASVSRSLILFPISVCLDRRPAHTTRLGHFEGTPLGGAVYFLSYQSAAGVLYRTDVQDVSARAWLRPQHIEAARTRMAVPDCPWSLWYFAR